MKSLSIVEYNKVLASIGSFLPQALDNTDPEKIMAILEQKSEEEKAALVRSLNEYLTGQSPVIEQPTADDFTITKLNTLPVNYGASVSRAIRPGKYEWKDGDIIQKHFPRKRLGKAEVEISLFCFGRDMSTKAVLKAMNKAGYRPAELLELLAIGGRYRNLQKEFPIIALGSVWGIFDYNRRVPCLDWVCSNRSLSLSWLHTDWGGSCRFAGVRK